MHPFPKLAKLVSTWQKITHFFSYPFRFHSSATTSSLYWISLVSLCMQKVSSENAPDLFVRINPSSTTPTSTLSKVAPDPDGNKKNMAQTTQNNPVGTNIDLRHVYLNASENNPTQSNVVKTSTYSWWNFIPLFLFFQFKRPANVYFLTICILQVSCCFLFFVCLLPLTQEPRATIIALVCHLCSTPQFLVVFQFFMFCFFFFAEKSLRSSDYK